jgi:hypothetical protein
MSRLIHLAVALALISSMASFGAGDARATSLYYLDFDPEPPFKDAVDVHPYSPGEKMAVFEALSSMYSAFPHIMFTLDEPSVPHSPVRFNSTAIGTSTGIDFRNVADIDSAAVNALKGFAFVGVTSPSPTDVVKASVNLAGHEVGHLEGLRHHDSYTPIGGGMPSLVVADYFPDYAGPAGAVFTYTDVMSLTASIPAGFSASQLTSPLIIGQRSAIKLAYNGDPGFFTESVFDPHGTPETAAALPLKTIGVPNVTFPSDPIHDKFLLADVVAIKGSIGPPGPSGLESDYYSFFAYEGDLIQIEVLSEIISSRGDEFDVKLLVFDPDETDPDAPGLYYGGDDNADERESTDSLMIDLIATYTGDYVIQVTPQSVHDPMGDYELYVASFRAVPEPGAAALCLLSLAAAASIRRRRNRRDLLRE